LASADHLLSTSPCIGVGSTNYISGTDIDGEGWNTPPSMGCDEFNANTTGSGDLSLEVSRKLVGVNFPLLITPSVLGHCTQSTLSFGDGTILTNRIGKISHDWGISGTYNIVLTAYNAMYPSGLSVTQQVLVVESTQYVSPVGNDANDGLSWATPKKTIQAAVNIASTIYGGTVWVTNGTYLVDSEILITNVIAVQSVNGATDTIIDGGGAHRCFNLGSSACTIRGFTIQHGYSLTDGGGIYCSSRTPIVENCIIKTNSATSDGGGVCNGTANNCTIVNNSAKYGGGMYNGTVNNCTIINNSATSNGGGIFMGTVNNCTIMNNSAEKEGGGICRGMANNCIVWYNRAPEGSNLISTTARYSCSPDVTNGSDGCITNEPVMASTDHLSLSSPCIGAGSFLYCHGTDLDGETWEYPPSMGCDEFNASTIGSLSLSLKTPSLVAVNSSIPIIPSILGPCTQFTISFGDGMVLTNQIGEVSHTWVSEGTYPMILTGYSTTYPSGLSVTQQVLVVEDRQYVSPVGNDANDGLSWATPKKTIQAAINIESTIYGGTVWVTNGTYLVDAEILITNIITLQSANGANDTIIDGAGAHRCFNLGSTACTVRGFTIQNGYSASDGGGIYCSSVVPVVENCIIKTNSAKYGGGMYNGTVNNCTIINNSATSDGGGIYNGIVNNCTIINNSAMFSGGGMYYGTVNNCTIINNSAIFSGGGMCYGTANNCTIINNSASSKGGGIYRGTANNCIVWGNAAPEGNDLRLTTARYSCSPDVTSGVDGNITNAPSFVDQAAENYHLKSDSPCINWGNNSAAKGSVDLDGNPRIVEVYVDMGCYEYQGLIGLGGDQDGNGYLDAWEREHFGGHVNPNENADGDPQSNGEEYITGTDPLDSSEYFYIVSTTNAPNGFSLYFNSVTNRKYQLFTTTNLTENSWVPVLPIRSGVGALDSMSDTNAIPAHKFYQIKVSLP